MIRSILLIFILSACGDEALSFDPLYEPIDSENYKQLHIDSGGYVLLPYVELSENQNKRLMTPQSEFAEIDLYTDDKDDARSASLREKMSPVRNQKYRPSCTAFAAIALFEYYYPGKDFSEQCLVKFSSNYDGGYMPNRINYAIKNGLYLEKDCPYKGYPRQRSIIPSLDKAKKTYPSDGFNYLSTADESQITFIRQRLRAGHPVSIAIFVAGKGWKSTGELLAAPTQEELEEDCVKSHSGLMRCGAHAVVVTGYGEHNNIPYLEFKNSWGNRWGDNGYGKISLGYFVKMRLADVIAR